MSENNNPNPNTLDLETYSYLKTEYGTAQKELREKITAKVLQGEIDREANKATQLNNALHQPKHIPSSYTNKVVKETIDQQKQADQRISEAQQKRIDEEFTKQNAELESILFMDFGGSSEKAADLMRLHEENRKKAEMELAAKDQSSLSLEGKPEASKESNSNERGENSKNFNEKSTEAPGGMEMGE